ncbi:hypothetical protein Tco_0992501 [Tanacetum coccineum]|uniref:Uncharacterized protein n=1 Tax=Tanacetum coccineum TaxID=301880 RepID=A0ABQ5F3Z5_9ASTR
MSLKITALVQVVKRSKQNCLDKSSKSAERGVNSGLVSSTHGTSPVALDSGNEVEDVFNETVGFMASTSSKVEKYPKSGSGVESKSMYEQWRENYVQDPYDDDDFDDCDLTSTALQFANAFDINLRG